MVKSFLKVAAGGAAAQLINIIAIPVLSRFYKPEDFAVWGLFLFALTLISSVSTLRYELAVVIPKEDDKAVAVLWGGAICVVMFSVLGGIILSQPAILGLLGLRESLDPDQAITLFALGISSAGATNLLTNWAVRCELFGLTSVAQVALTVVTVAFQFGWVLHGLNGPNGLLWGVVVGQASALAVFGLGLWALGHTPCVPNRFQTIVGAMREHYRFPFYSVPYTVSGVARERAAVVFMEQHFSRNSIGSYALISGLLKFPVGLVSAAIRPVLYRRLAADGVNGCERQIGLILAVLVVVSTPWLALCMVASEDLIPWLLGKHWTEKAELAKILIWVPYTFLFCNWMDRILDVSANQRLGLLLELLFSACSLAALAFTFMVTGSLWYGLCVQCFVLVIYNITYLIVAYRIARYDQKAIAKLLPLALLVYALFHIIGLCLYTRLGLLSATVSFSVLVLAFYAVAARIRWKDLSRVLA